MEFTGKNTNEMRSTVQLGEGVADVQPPVVTDTAKSHVTPPSLLNVKRIVTFPICSMGGKKKEKGKKKASSSH